MWYIKLKITLLNVSKGTNTFVNRLEKVHGACNAKNTFLSIVSIEVFQILRIKSIHYREVISMLIAMQREEELTLIQFLLL